MKTFGAKLKELRIDKGLTQDELVNTIKSKYERTISKSMISKWENGREEPQKFSDVSMLADLFNIKCDYLIGVTEDKYGEELEYKKIPVIGTIAAGIPILAQQDIISYEYIPIKEKIDFCFLVKGDSMINARIFDGDIVYIHQQPEVENGEIAAVQIDGEVATLKRVYHIGGNLILRPENPSYKDIIFSKKDKKSVQVLGKAISFKSEVK
ncbi:helix-turn-helix domain-containing protein [Clostridium sp. DL1XJH146]